MNDKQQLAAMGEHMREMEECKPNFKVPHGWRLVPDTPSSEMIIRGGEEFFDSARAWERGVTITDQDYAIMIYCQMLAAAPEYKP